MVVVDIAKGPAEAFGPLKAVLESISVLYTKYQVLFFRPVRCPPLTIASQGTVDVKNKIEILCSRIATLVKLIGGSPSSNDEKKRREGLVKYVSCLRSGWILKSL